MNEWNNYFLESLAEITSSKRIFYSEYVDSGVPFYRSKEVINLFKREQVQTELFITHQRFSEIEAKFGVPKENDILLTSVGSLGIPYLVKANDKFYFKDGNLTWFRNIDKELLYPKYLYIWLSSSIGKQKLDEVTIGSTQAALTISGLKSIEVGLPPLPEQKAIASVLSSLDDKIDLLHRQNKTLEAMAETLFRQWFIEEAKEDWEDGTLDQLIDLKYGKALKQEDRSGSGYPVVASSGIVGFHNNYLVKGPGIVIGRKGTLGKVYFMEDNFYPIDTSYFIETKTSGSNLIFEYYLLKSLDFANMNSDSAVPGLNRNIALGTQIQVPPEELILSFNGTAQPWFSKIHSNTKQIQTLEKLRDTLLPKLMSGEARVQYQTEEVA